jgi:hypothetical protein
MPSSTEEGFDTPPTGVHSVSVKLPPFLASRFRTIFASFSLKRVTDDQTKFEYALTTLDPDTQERVADFFDDLPPAGRRYDAFKLRLLDSFTVNQFQRMSSIVSLSLGDDTPSQLLDRMLALYRPDTGAYDNPLLR